MFSSPAPGRDSHLSFPIISSGFWGMRSRGGGNPITSRGARLPVPWEARCRRVCSRAGCIDAFQLTDRTTGMVEGKGMQPITRTKSEQDDTGGKKAAFIRATKLHLVCTIPPSCFKTRASLGPGMAVEAGRARSSSDPMSSPPSPACTQRGWAQTL